MNNPKLAFVYPPEVEGISYPENCPFKTQRATLSRSKIVSFGLLAGPDREEVPGRWASLSELRQVHTEAYLNELQRAASGDLSVEGFGMGLGGPETPVFKHMFDYGALACGSGLVAADLLLSGQANVAFNLLGGQHHTGPGHAAGFCYLNDVALACHHLAAAGRRVVYLDIDAHHGDGVQEIFYERPDVFTISMHESGKTLFPWSGFEDEIGRGAGLGYNANIPLPAGTYDDAFLAAFQDAALPLITAYQPDVILLVLGMDILAGDPLTHLHMTNNVVPDVLEALMRLDRPLLVTGAGGYHVENTVRAWTLAWRTCTGDGDHDVFTLGLGGDFLGNSEWAGGLRDRQLLVTQERHAEVDPELFATLTRLKREIFCYHGLDPESRGNRIVVT